MDAGILRDAESRVRFLGYSVTGAKLFVWTVSGVLAGIAGALYVPQVGIINPPSSRRRTRSRSRSGSRSAVAARWSARCSAPPS
jgi:urea transport system permease protein